MRIFAPNQHPQLMHRKPVKEAISHKEFMYASLPDPPPRVRVWSRDYDTNNSHVGIEEKTLGVSVFEFCPPAADSPVLVFTTLADYRYE